MVLFQPKYPLGQPEKYLNFHNLMNVLLDQSIQKYFILFSVQEHRQESVLLFANFNNLFFEYFDPGKKSLDHENN